MSLPNHRPPAVKFNPNEMMRSLVPFTQEDKGLYGNLPLVNTLRMPIQTPNYNAGGTNCDPPGFFDDDQEKWRKKFQNALKDRKEFKKRFLNGKVENHILNTNENLDKTSVHNDWD